jgi:exodeoxyribonuclease V beta subunit
MQGTAFADREEHELRLESDEAAVRIITVHKSKGLEFEVVFCPFTWWNGQTRAAFHDPENAWRLTLDLADRDAHKAERAREALAENLRLLYVAVTRAKHRCTMVWRAGEKPEKSACARLLGGGSQPAITSSGEIVVTPVPVANAMPYTAAAEAAPTPTSREFRGAIDRSWGVASFSRLISGRETDHSDEGVLVESGGTLLEEEEATALTGMHAFPRGMRAGTCLHEIIEQVEFGSLTSAGEIVPRKLRSYGYEAHEQAVLENVRALAQLPLAGFTLAATEPTSRIAELEFSFPITELTASKLAAAAGQQLPFATISGLMNGKIDLVLEHTERFYIFDWKSNWLGPTTRSYHAAALAAEMQRNVYRLQLCIYTVALHRYLQVRKRGYDPARHLGGAFYIFLRGIDPQQPQNGVYHERLERAFVEELSAILS